MVILSHFLGKIATHPGLFINNVCVATARGGRQEGCTPHRLPFYGIVNVQDPQGWQSEHPILARRD